MKSRALLLVVFAANLLAGSVSYYPYSYTDATPNQMAGERDGSELRTAKPDLIRNFLCGSYRGKWDLTGGNTLYLFPDGTAMISEWCDICPEKLVAEGTWTLEGQAVRANWKRYDFGSKELEEMFIQRYGQSRDFTLYLSFIGKVVKNTLLVSRDQEKAEIRLAWFKDVDYYDWSKIRDRLKKGQN